MLIVAVSQCKQVTSEEVMDLKSLARGLPSCVLKKVKAMRMLMDKRELRNITKRMRRGQLKAVLQRVSDEHRLNVGINDKHLFGLQTKAGEGLCLTFQLTFGLLKHLHSNRHSIQSLVSLQLAKDVQPLEMVQKLDDNLLCSMSLKYLTKVNITSLDQVNNKTWCPAQVTSMATSSPNLS